MLCCKCDKRFYYRDMVDHNYPYILKCGHSICEICLRNIRKFANVVECKICDKTTEVPIEFSKNSKDLYPLNYHLLGQIIVYANSSVEDVTFINRLEKYLSPPIKNKSGSEPHQSNQKNDVVCGECLSAASCTCNKCDANYCDGCFKKTHDFISKKKHLKLPLVNVEYTSNSKCEVHPDKYPGCYCKTCSKDICFDCAFSPQHCMGHDIIFAQDQQNEIRDYAEQNISIVNDRLSKLLTAKNVFDKKLPQDYIDLKNKINEYFTKPLALMEYTKFNLLHRLKTYFSTKSSEVNDALLTHEKNLTEVLDILEMCIHSDHKNMPNIESVKKRIDALPAPWHFADDVEKYQIFSTDETKLSFMEQYCTMNDNVNIYDLQPSPEVETEKVITGTARMQIADTSNKKCVEPEVSDIIVGSSVEIVVTYIVDPHNFFVQRLVHRDFLRDHLDKFYNSEETNLGEVQIEHGKIYVYNDKKKIFRVLVTKIVDGDVKCDVRVKLLDYGYEKNVQSSSLKRIDPLYETIPPMALPCFLADCNPPSNGWPEDINDVILRTVNCGKCCLMHVKQITNDRYDVDVLTSPLSNGDFICSLRDFLLFTDRAKLGNFSREVNKTSNWPKNVFKIIKKRILRTVSEEVWISHVVSPDEFFVRQVAVEESYNTLRDQLNSTYSVKSEAGLTFVPKIGIYVACFVKDLLWCRGCITYVKNKDHLRVYLVDHGRKEIVTWSNLRPLKDTFYDCKEFAIHCKLAEIKPVHDVWCSEAIKLLKECEKSWIPSKIVAKTFFIKNRYVFLSSCLNSESKCINDELVNRGYALYIRSKVISTESSDQINAPEVNDKSTMLLTALSSVKTSPSKKPTFDCGNRIPIKIISAASPSSINITIISQEEELQALSKEMQAYFENTKPKLDTEWKIADKCAVLCDETETWNRGIIDQINANVYRVCLIDIMQFKNVQSQDLRELPSHFKKVKDGSIECVLSGILPAVGSKWPGITCEYLQEIISEQKNFFILKDGAVANRKLPVQLWLYKETAFALEPTVREWKKVNDMIIAQGLAIRDSDYIDKTEPEMTENTESKVIDNTESKMTENTPSETEVSKPIMSKITVNDVQSLVSEISTVPTVQKKWIRPPLPKGDFHGIVTNIDDDFVISILDKSQEVSLGKLNTDIAEHFGSSVSQPKDMFWSPGQPCIAQWSLNMLYYRGEVKKVLDNNNVVVTFVDYGNEEECSVANTRKDIILDDVPIYAVNCKIVGLRPIGGQWTDETIDLVDQALVENCFFINVLGTNETEDVLYIKLNMPEGTDLVNWLVQKNLAEYDDYPRMLPIKTPFHEAVSVENSCDPEDDPDIIEYDPNVTEDFETVEEKCKNFDTIDKVLEVVEHPVVEEDADII